MARRMDLSPGSGDSSAGSGDSSVGSGDSGAGSGYSSAGSGESTTQPPPGDAQLRDWLRPAGPTRFELSLDSQPGAAIVRVKGELDILTAPKLAARLAAVIRSTTEDLVIDLRAVDFIDSTGLQILMSTRRRLVRGERRLSVLCENGSVRRVIEMTRLTDALGVVGPAEHEPDRL